MVKISSVEKNSPADKAGVMAGDILLSIDGNDITDVLDYRFYITEKKVTLTVERDGKILNITTKKPQYDDIGLEFDTYLMDEQRSCTNKCVFCFIDQNPKGMRQSCYFKDDDSRLSFFYGNYVTLTNMKKDEVERLIKLRISPINISVHTTNPELRKKMLCNKFAGEVLEYLDMFKNGGIQMNFQIVLCRGLNDGDELCRTLDDLSGYFPSAESIAVVPAGLTKHRDGLYPLEDFTPNEAAEVIAIVDEKRRQFEQKFGHRIVQCADEWYLKAGLDLPSEDYYDGYPQLDNGVGLLCSLENEATERMKELIGDGFALSEKRHISSVTGRASFGLMSRICAKLCESFKNLDYKVYPIVNEFFGHTVTVSGLVTGGDIKNQIGGKELGSELLLPLVMLRHEGDLFLDGMSIEELEDGLGVKITCVPNDGYELVDAVLGINIT